MVNNENTGKMIVTGSIIEAVENQLRDNDPEFVTEIFLSIQKKGYNRKQARTLIASVLMEEMSDLLKHKRGYDGKRYESGLKKRSRSLTGLTMVPNVILPDEEEINENCKQIWEAISDDDMEEAVIQFLVCWPGIKEYVIHNLYRDTPSGTVKPEFADISMMTEYEMDFDALLSDMGTILCNANRYQEAIDFSKEVLELFRWENGGADSFKDDIGQALADMGRKEKPPT